MNKIDEIKDKLWSAIRTLIDQGTSIEQDYKAGKYNTYEEFSARLDAAACERIDWLYEIITSSREPIAEPEHSIHTLAEDQKDLDPKINKMVNERFWELLEDKPNALNEWNKIDVYPCNLNCNSGFIIAKGNAMRDELKAYIDKLRQPIAEPERLVKAREKYLTELEIDSYREDTKSDNYIRELEARVKELEEK